MRYLLFPVFLIAMAQPTQATAQPAQGKAAQRLADFSRFSKAINKEISLVEADGTVREGVLVAADSDSITMKFASGARSFAHRQIASAERMKDERSDGAVNGLAWGLLLALMPNQGLNSSDSYLAYIASSMVTFAAIGYVIDAAQTNRQPLYRAPAQQTAGAKLKPALSSLFRF